MLARQLWVAICLELAGIVALARWALEIENPLTLAGLALGVHLGLRGVVAFASLSIAGAWRAPPSLGIGHALRLFVAEAAAMTALHTVIIPLQRWLVPLNPAADEREGQPLLLIHGYFCARGVWWSLRRYLRRNGVRNIYMLDLEPTFGDIDDYVRQLDARIADIAAEQPGKRLMLIAHSMGGLVALRHAAVSPRDGSVTRVVSIASPHHGTRLARLGLGLNARQMRPNSDWLAEHHAAPAGIDPESVTSIYSAHDNIVSPQDSAILEAAENIRLVGTGHMELLFGEEMQRLVLERVQRHRG